MGDFNARTGNLCDFVLADDFLANDQECVSEFCNEGISLLSSQTISLNRTTQDTIKNNYGYNLVEFCTNNDIFIANGRLGKDKSVGRLTCRQEYCRLCIVFCRYMNLKY
jgi:hypothetical protein